MRNRWGIYFGLGLAFGIADWYFLDLLASFGRNEAFNIQMQQAPAIARLLIVVLMLGLNYGIWLVPVIPVAIYEYRSLQSLRKAALSAVLVWSAAIFSYYAFYTGLLMFSGLPGMEFMLYANRALPGYWNDWWVSFQQVILNQFVEWIGVAVVGGAITGWLSGLLARRFARRRPLMEIPT